MRFIPKLLQNYFSLSSLQIANFVIPLITVPYISRTIGPNYYGLVNYANAFVAYFILIVNYGFDLTATREIAIHRDNKRKVSEIFCSIFYIKLILFIISSMIFFAFIAAGFSQDKLVLVLSYSAVLGSVFYPNWIFQGMEKLTQSVILNFVAKIALTILIFIVITHEHDYLLLIILNSAAQVVLGIGGFVYAYFYFNLEWEPFSYRRVIKYLNDGWMIFVSSIFTNISTYTTILLVGIFSSNVAVGYYSASLKILSAFTGLTIYPMSITVFPFLNKVFSKSKDEGLQKLQFIVIVVVIVTAAESLFMFLFSEKIIQLIYGPKFSDAVLALKIMSILPLISSIVNLFAFQTLLVLKLDKIFLRIIFAGAVINLLSNVVLIHLYSQNGAAVTLIISEVFIVIASYLSLKKQGIQMINPKAVKDFMPKYFGI